MKSEDALGNEESVNKEFPNGDRVRGTNKHGLCITACQQHLRNQHLGIQVCLTGSTGPVNHVTACTKQNQCAEQTHKPLTGIHKCASQRLVLSCPETFLP